MTAAAKRTRVILYQLPVLPSAPGRSSPAPQIKMLQNMANHARWPVANSYRVGFDCVAPMVSIRSSLPSNYEPEGGSVQSKWLSLLHS